LWWLFVVGIIIVYYVDALGVFVDEFVVWFNAFGATVVVVVVVDFFCLS